MVDFSGLLQVAGSAFLDWLKLFAAPLKNLEMLWIIIPIWGSWFFAEFFQEKKGTSYGNAIANGVVMLFVGIDWIRYAIGQATDSGSFLARSIILEALIAAFILILGMAIIVLGIRANPVVRLIGRVREVSYLMIMFTPIVYGVVEFNLRVFIIIFAFLPLFYLLVEIIDRITPSPKATEIEEEEKQLKSGAGLAGLNAPGSLGNDFGPDIFSQFPPQLQQPQGGFQQQPPQWQPQPQQQWQGRRPAKR